jgi:hypothetical protein
MRVVLVLAALMTFLSIKAQTAFPESFADYTQRETFADRNHLKDSARHKNWFLSKYSGISTSFSFFRGGNATTIAVPMGLQLNRRLNNNLYAFAGISVAPAYISFNHAFLSPTTDKFYQNNTFLKSNSFNMYSRAELGLMYINDEKTFSISGSIGVERSNYPVFPYPIYNKPPTNPVVVPNR